ncbi:Protein DEFECTIVE IN MERISTEM SILENCING 3 [Abeliophyllum distichum]|uniref:Protein DEFECTIVE IN MERISTEM SILENCING 3 n=1 Tax=Abeliophyllum distichum TaxID=126358 RepID=A0ABD1VXY6_9LAMI
MYGGDQRRMSVDNESAAKHSINMRQLVVSDPSALRHIGQNGPYMVSTEVAPNGGHSQAEAVVNYSKKLQDDLQVLGQKIKYHEDNVKYLKTLKNRLEDSILDMQVSLGKYHTTSISMMENEDPAHLKNEAETVEHILRHEKSAAGILCQLKTQHETQASDIQWTKDVVGIVATLGKVDDDNLSRLLSQYLGLETMLAIVCNTYEGVKALEAYDKEGLIDKSSGLHALGASIGRPLDGRFLVICLEHLRPYVGKYIADDPQKRLDLLKPRLPNGETPPGFLGYAYTDQGENMLKALPCIANGAISLDGGMIKSPGCFSLGHKGAVDVKFPKSSERLNLPENYFETETRMKETRWKVDRTLEDIQREQTLLDHAKFNFETKKREFVQFLADSSSYAAPPRYPPGRVSTPR